MLHFMKIYQLVQTLLAAGIDRQHGDLICLLFFFQGK
jgi:hypothetical protein